ncbi:hypothetical protein PMY38_06410 [Clostridium tertium]|uniref:hypothetical protein n=1 Tax=Clostridium tertium TaxID=1559 RepID=UPI0018A0BB34|nr:hypothetical protein [Clostridium tertium]MDB1947684.1 hypothetical protein [Clostridium tertium]MDB1956318.1 hypothetical protein [Clostridium tertium]MDB1958224.1 hypothetical protein [Clostridium tertium]MDB1961590.1 hypothetical protein [Clostridium tertium]MDB1967322.1 hypothetical protein [Clostridium tertium]
MTKYTKYLREANENKMKRVASYCDDILIKIYDNICATEEDGFDYRHVSKCANGIRKTHKSLEWRFI